MFRTLVDMHLIKFLNENQIIIYTDSNYPKSDNTLGKRFAKIVENKRKYKKYNTFSSNA